MNNEKKIAQAILHAQKMREESYYFPTGDVRFGEYKLNIEDCLIATCKQQGLSENLWYLLSLAMYGWNDIQLWAEDVLAGKNILDECKKENVKMKDNIKRVEDAVDELVDNDEALSKELTAMNEALKAEKEQEKEQAIKNAYQANEVNEGLENESCPCDHASKDACNQCQETDTANPSNH